MGLISRVSSRTYRKLKEDKKTTTMQLFVQGNALQTLEVTPQMTIGQLQQCITEEMGRLVSNGQILDNADATIEDYGIVAESTIQLIEPVLGGGRKRKKKVYTTPKKIKHKRVKVKLATLKMYKVDDNGKLERKRKECSQPQCGAGIFMGNHKDRQYCGKCGFTIKFNENEKK